MQNIEYRVYKKIISNFYDFLKKKCGHEQSYLKSIPVTNLTNFILVPLSYSNYKDKDIIAKLCEWRNQNIKVFIGNRKTNFKNTSKWIVSKNLKIKDKILFLVYHKYLLIGHIGFANCFNKKFFFEIDNVIRGESTTHKNSFSIILNELINWAKNTLYVEGFYLKVKRNNSKAIQFYKKNNFIETKNYFENGKVPDEYIYMKLSVKDKIKKPILTAGPSISQKEIFYSYDATKNAWNNKSNYYISKLENKFSKYVECKYSIATSSCTGALQISLAALDIKPRDEVIVPDITWVATASVVKFLGAKPVFADVNYSDLTININKLQKLITKKTKAIIPVHLYGYPANMLEIVKFAKKYNLHIVEDSAAAIGATYNNIKCGSFGDFSAFSFQGAKLLVSGEGGILTTNSKKLYEAAYKISQFGRNPKKTFWIDGEGYKFKMSNAQAALALAQLERVNELHAMKRRIHLIYKEELKNFKKGELICEQKNTKSIHWMNTIKLNKKYISRDKLTIYLKKNGIDSRPIFPSISSYPIWKHNNNYTKNYISKKVCNNGLNLPSGVNLNKSEIQYICKKIKEYS